MHGNIIEFGTAFIIYGAIKLLFYSFWCLVGIRIFQLSELEHKIKKYSFYFGFIRTLMGIVFGALFMLLGWLTSTDFKELTAVVPPPAWLLILVLFRWIEWSIMEIIMNKNARTLSANINPTMRSFLWRVFGILLSFVADFATIIGLAVGLPGRMC